MGDKIGNSNVLSEHCDPSSQQESQPAQSTPTRRGRKKSSVNSKREVISPEEENGNIKYRLRTPKKLCRDTVSEANANQLKKQYHAEGVSLQTYLIKGGGAGSKSGVDADVYTVLFDEGIRSRSVSLDRVHFPEHVNAKSQRVCNNKEGSGVCVNGDSNVSSCPVEEGDNVNKDVTPKCDSHYIKGASGVTYKYKGSPQNRSSILNLNMEGNGETARECVQNNLPEGIDTVEDNTEKTSASSSKPPPPINIQKPSESKLLEEEIRQLEKKLKGMANGSMERMFTELRIDMKKDGLKIMRRFDKVERSSDSLASDVKKLKDHKVEVEQAIEHIVSTQVEEKVCVDETNAKMNMMKEEIRVLSGQVQKQSQMKFLDKAQEEQKLLFNTKDNLLITGLDEEEDKEAETTTAEMVTDLFT